MASNFALASTLQKKVSNGTLLDSKFSHRVSPANSSSNCYESSDFMFEWASKHNQNKANIRTLDRMEHVGTSSLLRHAPPNGMATKSACETLRLPNPYRQTTAPLPPRPFTPLGARYYCAPVPFIQNTNSMMGQIKPTTGHYAELANPNYELASYYGRTRQQPEDDYDYKTDHVYEMPG